MRKQQGLLEAVHASPKCIAGQQQLTLSASWRAGWPVQKLAGLMSPCRTPLLCLQCICTRVSCCMWQAQPCVCLHAGEQVVDSAKSAGSQICDTVEHLVTKGHKLSKWQRLSAIRLQILACRGHDCSQLEPCRSRAAACPGCQVTSHLSECTCRHTEGSHLKPCNSPAAQQQDQTSQLRSLGTLTKDTCTAQALTQQLHGDKCVNAIGTPDQAKLEDPAH